MRLFRADLRLFRAELKLFCAQLRLFRADLGLVRVADFRLFGTYVAVHRWYLSLDGVHCHRVFALADLRINVLLA